MIESTHGVPHNSDPVNCILFAVSTVPFALETSEIFSISSLSDPLRAKSGNDLIVGRQSIGNHTDLPLVSIHSMLGEQPDVFEQGMAVLVLPVGDQQAGTPIGLLVDEVNEVTSISRSLMKPTPWLGRGVELPYIRGVIPEEEQSRFILALSSLLPADFLNQLQCNGITT